MCGLNEIKYTSVSHEAGRNKRTGRDSHFQPGMYLYTGPRQSITAWKFGREAKTGQALPIRIATVTLVIPEMAGKPRYQSDVGICAK